jgi:hypothetical protein
MSKLYGLTVWTEYGNRAETFPHISGSREKLLAKYEEVVAKMYADAGGEEETELTLEEYKESFYMTGEDWINELEVL